MGQREDSVADGAMETEMPPLPMLILAFSVLSCSAGSDCRGTDAATMANSTTTAVKTGGNQNGI